MLLGLCAGLLPARTARAQVAASDPRPEVVRTRRLPGFSLIDATTGRELTANSFRGSWTLVYVGYTSCPDVCPTTMLTVAQAFQRASGALPVRMLFITVDPKRDRPEVLKAYVQSFSPRITAGWADGARWRSAMHAFGMQPQVHGDPSSMTYTVDHATFGMLFSPDGAWVRMLPHGMSAAELERALLDAASARAGRT